MSDYWNLATTHDPEPPAEKKDPCRLCGHWPKGTRGYCPACDGKLRRGKVVEATDVVITFQDPIGNTLLEIKRPKKPFRWMLADEAPVFDEVGGETLDRMAQLLGIDTGGFAETDDGLRERIIEHIKPLSMSDRPMGVSKEQWGDYLGEPTEPRDEDSAVWHTDAYGWLLQELEGYHLNVGPNGNWYVYENGKEVVSGSSVNAYHAKVDCEAALASILL